jgi:hypothetical protein
MSTTDVRLDHATGAALAAKLIAALAPSCERIEVAGSLRRNQKTVNDLELVAIPRMTARTQKDLFGQEVEIERISQLDATLGVLLKADKIRRDLPPGIKTTTAWGERYKKFWVWASSRIEWVQVDLFICTPTNFGAIFCIRTGSADFSAALQSHIKHKTPYRQQDGDLVLEATGAVVPVPDEAMYFKLAGVPYIEPAHRIPAVLKRVLREQREANQTTVVNIRSQGGVRPEYDVYIGRTNSRARLPASKWANPFTVGQVGSHQAAVDAYREWIEQPEQAHLLRAIPELVGQRLGCWCKPAPCHGDVLARYANAYAAGNWQPPSDGGPPAPPVEPVKALSLWQPWASLIAAGLKRYETRHWRTGYRGLLAIHAAKREPDIQYEDLLDDVPDSLTWPPPLGEVVCLARLVDIVPTDRLMTDPDFKWSLEYGLGDYSPGRYAWRLEVVEVYDPPIPARGAQGLFEWTPPTKQTSPTRHCIPDEEIRAFIRARLEAVLGD